MGMLSEWWLTPSKGDGDHVWMWWRFLIPGLVIFCERGYDPTCPKFVWISESGRFTNKDLKLTIGSETRARLQARKPWLEYFYNNFVKQVTMSASEKDDLKCSKGEMAYCWSRNQCLSYCQPKLKKNWPLNRGLHIVVEQGELGPIRGGNRAYFREGGDIWMKTGKIRGFAWYCEVFTWSTTSRK